MFINKAIIVGNLTRDPEIKAMPSGDKICSFSVATNRVYKDRDGNKKEASEFHNIVVFGKQAETSGQYLKKGQSVAIEGRLQTRSWDDQATGQKKYRTEIVADRVQFGPKAGGGSGTGNYSSNKVSADKGDNKKEDSPIEYPSEEINPEDIPF